MSSSAHTSHPFSFVETAAAGMSDMRLDSDSSPRSVDAQLGLAAEHPISTGRAPSCRLAPEVASSSNTSRVARLEAKRAQGRHGKARHPKTPDPVSTRFARRMPAPGVHRRRPASNSRDAPAEQQPATATCRWEGCSQQLALDIAWGQAHIAGHVRWAVRKRSRAGVGADAALRCRWKGCCAGTFGGAYEGRFGALVRHVRMHLAGAPGMESGEYEMLVDDEDGEMETEMEEEEMSMEGVEMTGWDET